MTCARPRYAWLLLLESRTGRLRYDSRTFEEGDVALRNAVVALRLRGLTVHVVWARVECAGRLVSRVGR